MFQTLTRVVLSIGCAGVRAAWRRPTTGGLTVVVVLCLLLVASSGAGMAATGELLRLLVLLAAFLALYSLVIRGRP